MAVVRGEFVHFQIREASGARRCQISQAALLIRERLDMRDGSAETVLMIFEKYRPEIERMAQAIAKQAPGRRPRIIITTAEFND
jgi:uncharacterized protein YxjI